MGIINDSFMLKNKTGEALFHEYAENLPIIDYHCHLSPKEIAEDHTFRSVTELMLGGDHYKWRFMRSAGVTEDKITGEASDFEKWQAWAKALPMGIGNPLYHWTHLELKRYFGVDDCLNGDNAREIFDHCNKLLATPDFSAGALIARSDVETICTTDDPTDDLGFHAQIAESGMKTRVLPAFRPDKAVNITAPGFMDYIKKCDVKSYDELLCYMQTRLDYFGERGCKLSDHGLEKVVYARGDASAVFEKRMNGGKLTAVEEAIYRTELFLFFGREYARRGWVMQMHMGATRNNNTRMFREHGPDFGFDAVGDKSFEEPLSRLLDALDVDDLLPQTILYTLNNKDNYMLGAMIGSFQKGPTVSKIQLGSGWWFCDQRDGMEAQLKALGNLGCLGGFVGMLTDSRSFISYPRHEYFRRILCNLIGKWVEEGEYPDDRKALETIITGISYRNAHDYFNF